MPQRTFKGELYFDDPRLRMSVLGRIFVRVVSYIGHLLLVAAVFTFLLSDLEWVFWFGILLGLLLFDRLIHLHEADRPIYEMPIEGKVNLARYTTPHALSVVERSYDHALVTRSNLFLEACLRLLAFAEAKEMLRRLDIDYETFKKKTEDALGGSVGGAKQKSELQAETYRLMFQAFSIANDNNHPFISVGELFAALPLIGDKDTDQLFGGFRTDAHDVAQALLFSSAKHRFKGLRRFPKTLGALVKGHGGIRHRVMNRAWTSRPTPTLDRYSEDLTDLARQEEIGFLIGHEKDYERLIDSLSRTFSPNALLVGEVGVGKETIVAHLAYKIAKDQVPASLFDKRLVSLRLSNLVAGAAPEELQTRLKKIVEEIILAGNIILYIPEIHNLVHTSGTAYLSAADALMPIIMNNAFPVVGATYPREFKQLIEPRSDFVGVFEVIPVEEMAERDAEKLLIFEALLMEEESKLLVSFGAVKTAVKLAKKYLQGKFLPGSAEELLKDAVTLASRRKEAYVGPQIVIAAAEEKVNVPIHEAEKGEAETLLNLEATIHERLVDQEEAVHSVAEALRQYRSGLSRKGGPIASFLFVGPTGVGKTELSKILAGIQFGSEKAMVRFDMTEYQDKQSVSRLIGSSDGQISGALTEAVRQKPYSLVLLDEFEKAFPDILNIFLQVLDDGRLTDSFGRTVDFQNTIIIATSNAHSDIINKALREGKGMADIEEELKKNLVHVFKPELLNRFSKIIVFKNLTPEHIAKIVRLQLAKLEEQLKEQGISIAFDDDVVRRLAEIGFDPAFGARPLRRAIDETVKSGLSDKILRKEITQGSRVRVRVSGNSFEFQTL